MIRHNFKITMATYAYAYCIVAAAALMAGAHPGKVFFIIAALSALCLRRSFESLHQLADLAITGGGEGPEAAIQLEQRSQPNFAVIGFELIAGLAMSILFIKLVM